MSLVYSATINPFTETLARTIVTWILTQPLFFSPNNPGCIYDPWRTQQGQRRRPRRRFFPDVPLSSAGYLNPKTIEEGWELLYKYILGQMKRKDGTLRNLIRRWPDPHITDREPFLKYVAAGLSWPPLDVRLSVLERQYLQALQSRRQAPAAASPAPASTESCNAGKPGKRTRGSTRSKAPGSASHDPAPEPAPASGRATSL